MTEQQTGKTYIILNADKYRLHFWSRFLTRLTGFIVSLALFFSFLAMRENGEELNNRLQGNSQENLCRSRAAAEVDKAIIVDITLLTKIFAIGIRTGSESLIELQDELDTAVKQSQAALEAREASLTRCKQD